VKNLLNANDPDFINQKLKEKFEVERIEKLTKEQIEDTKKEFLDKACEIFNKPDARTYIEDVRKKHEQIIDTVNIDTVINADWDKQTQNQAQNTIETFRDFIRKNKDEITALKIFYNQPQRIKVITFKMINELYLVLKSPPYSLTVERLWGAYYQLGNNRVKGISIKRMLTDIVSLIRYELKIDKELAPFSEIVNRNFKDWVFRKNAGHIQFTEEQMEWLRMIKDHIMTSMKITQDNFNFTPFDALGGIGKFYQVFGEDYNKIINELNEVLVA
jgi:type I restriction enzyme R subunit